MNNERVIIKDAQDWQLDEILFGIADLDSGRAVSHTKVKKWLQSWGKPDGPNMKYDNLAFSGVDFQYM